MNAFLTAVNFVKKWEGGYSNHSSDPGGATNYGITQTRYNEYLQNKSILPMAVKNISTHEVEEIYNEIWISCGSAQMPDKLAIVHFDTSFNLGTRRAVRMLQEILGIEMDGKVGKETINACQIDGIALLYIDARDKYYHSISEKNIKLLVFLKGWLNRTSDLRKLL